MRFENLQIAALQVATRLLITQQTMPKWNDITGFVESD